MSDQEKKKSLNPKKSFDSYSKYSGMVVQMGIIIAGGTYGGILADRYFHLTFPVFTVILSLLSVFIAIFLMIRDIIRSNE